MLRTLFVLMTLLVAISVYLITKSTEWASFAFVILLWIDDQTDKFKR